MASSLSLIASFVAFARVPFGLAVDSIVSLWTWTSSEFGYNAALASSIFIVGMLSITVLRSFVVFLFKYILFTLLLVLLGYLYWDYLRPILTTKPVEDDTKDFLGVERTGQPVPDAEEPSRAGSAASMRITRREGWLYVRRAELDIMLATSQAASASAPDAETASIHSTSSTTSNSVLGGLANWSTSARGLIDGYNERSAIAAAAKRAKKAMEDRRVYAVLSDSTLALYEDAEKQNILYLIKVPLYTIGIESIDDQGRSTKMLDGELFVKKTIIALRLRPEQSNTAAPSPTSPGPHAEIPALAFHRVPKSSSNSADTGPTTVPEHAGPQPFMLSAKIQPDKEDWYHDLVYSCRAKGGKAIEKDQELFKSADMEHFLEGLDATPELANARVFNAALAALFFHNYRTSPVQDYILRKLKRKIEKLDIPSTFGGVKIAPLIVERIDVGNTVPVLSRWMLKQLNHEATFAAEANLCYKGNFVIKIATEATFPGVIGINKGAPSIVKVTANAIVKRIEGTICLNIKKMPSNRIWWGFTRDPILEVEIIPEVGPKQFRWGMLTTLLNTQIQKAMKESLVAPNMDDIAFMDTSDFSQRGGIWGDALMREAEKPASSASTSDGTDSSSLPAPVQNPAVDGHGLAPGVPNLKLGDPRPDLAVDTSAVTQGQDSQRLRQRPRPSGGAGAEPTRQVSGSSTTSTHAKKKSWFSSTTSLPAAFGTGTSSPSSPSPSPAVPSVPPLPASSSTSDLPTAAAASENTAAQERLRGILADSNGRSAPRSVSSSSVVSDAESTQGFVVEPPTPSDSHAQVLRSEPLHRSPSASSDDTTGASVTARNANESTDYAAYLEESVRASGSGSAASSPTKKKTLSSILSRASPNGAANGSGNRPVYSRKQSDRASSVLADDDSLARVPSGSGPSSLRSPTPVPTAAEASGRGEAPSAASTTIQSAQTAFANWKAKQAPLMANVTANVTAKVPKSWGNRINAYRGKSAADRAAEDLAQPQMQQAANAGTSSEVSSTLQGPRARSGSIVENGHIAPSASLATTSLIKPSTTDSASAIRRVPPPPTEPPFHPFSNSNTQSVDDVLSRPPPQHGKRDSFSSKAAYKPAAMMAVPSMPGERKFGLGSSQSSQGEQAPPPAGAGPVPAPVQRVPVPAIEELAAARAKESPVEATIEPSVPTLADAAAVPPPLPSRPHVGMSEPNEESGKAHGETEEVEASPRLDDSGIGLKSLS